MDLPALPQRSVRAGIAVAFAVIAIAVYGASLDNSFVHWDDGLLIYQNPAVIEMSWASVKRAFTTYDPELYVPLTLLSYQLDYAVGGGSAWPFHAQNLLLHTLNALGVCWLAYLLLRRGSVAIAIGLLFLLHPLHTEAVAWASARKDVLATFFFLASILSFLHYRASARIHLYRLSVGFFVLGLLAKVVIVTLPVLLLLLLWREHGKITRRDIIECIPFVICSVIFGIVAVLGKTEVAAASSLSDKILLAVRSTTFYLGKIVWPLDLSVLYPVTDPVRLFSPLYFFPLLLIVAMTAAAFVSLRKTREIAVWWVFYVVTLGPTFINIAKGDKGDLYVASDRYAYIPSIAVFLLIGWVVTRLLERQTSVRAQRQFTHQAGGTAVILLVICAWLSAKQSLVWRDTKTLFEHAIAHAIAPSYAAHTNVGNAYRQEGDIQRAIEEYEQSLAIKPHPRTYANLGAAQRQLGQFDAALASYNTALELDPDFELAHFGIGIVYAAQGLHDKAFAAYDRTLELDPDSGEVYTNIGALRMQRGETDLAIAAYEKAIEVEPAFPVSYYNLAVALAGIGRYEEAVTAYERSVELNPRSISTRINLGVLYARLGKQAEAIDQFRAILRMDPANKAAQSALQQLGADVR